MSQFPKIGIISKPDDPAIAATVQSLYKYLVGQSLEIWADKVSASFLASEQINESSLDEIASNSELVIVVGGDGTILHAAHSLIQKEIPLLGINLGRLGFLAEISPSEIEKQLGQILSGEYEEAQRIVLQASLIRDGKTIGSCCAINDVVVHAKQMVRMIEIESRVNKQYVNTLRADGYIVATPTGSTAYALSGGGPILHPNIDAIVLVPICPHTLSNRPIVVDAHSRVEILLSEENRHTALASIDGQIDMDFMPGDTIVIEKCKHVLRLIQPKNYDYFDVLRVKLRWSTSPDNNNK
ncbi:MAG: NAD(+) kinase [Gammaproteobacteria bacterium]|nr:NAD(+) kinase [Gammaproteobacteria bacterium]NNC67741.1 NAD(+) kinase [Gammaproteobacteria bacterium]